MMRAVQIALTASITLYGAFQGCHLAFIYFASFRHRSRRRRRRRRHRRRFFSLAHFLIP